MRPALHSRIGTLGDASPSSFSLTVQATAFRTVRGALVILQPKLIPHICRVVQSATNWSLAFAYEARSQPSSILTISERAGAHNTLENVSALRGSLRYAS